LTNANQQHFGGSAFDLSEVERHSAEFSQVQVCHHVSREVGHEHRRHGRRRAANREPLLHRRQIDDRDCIGTVQRLGTVRHLGTIQHAGSIRHLGIGDIRVGAVSRAGSVGGFLGKRCEFDVGGFKLFDQRWRQELLGEHFPVEWDLHTFGAKSAGCQRQRVQS